MVCAETHCECVQNTFAKIDVAAAAATKSFILSIFLLFLELEEKG